MPIPYPRIKLANENFGWFYIVPTIEKKKERDWRGKMAKNSVIRLDQPDVVTRSRIKGALHQFSCNFMAISWSLAKSCHGEGVERSGLGCIFEFIHPCHPRVDFLAQKSKEGKTVSILGDEKCFRIFPQLNSYYGKKKKKKRNVHGRFSHFSILRKGRIRRVEL